MNPINSNNSILLTFDVEDWFQVENFKRYISFSSWGSCELRVERNTHRLLDLLDSIKPLIRESARAQIASGFENAMNTIKPNNPSNPINPINLLGLASRGNNIAPYALRLTPYCSIKATFFVLGWIAKRLPHLVREIQARGHEVASHGYNHELSTNVGKENLKQDLMDSKKILEDILSGPVHGYRAPSFSISNDALKIIEESAYFYDSSFNSFGWNKRYGKIEFADNGSEGIALKVSEGLYELPISNLKLGGNIFPWGGGGFFRMLPFPLFKHGVIRILKQHNAYLFYFHPWEIDPDQPVVKEASWFYRLRHYANLNSSYSKFSSFLQEFKSCQFQTCYQYITSNNSSTGTPQNFIRQ